ncbi:hypothetical protein Droror1_Dr00016176 [Drosera rotundifolia]
MSIPRPHICSIPFPLSKIKNPLFAAVPIRSVIRRAPPLCHLPLSSFLPRRRRSLILLSGLSWSVDEKTLVDDFSSFGDITEVKSQLKGGGSLSLTRFCSMGTTLLLLFWCLL